MFMILILHLYWAWFSSWICLLGVQVNSDLLQNIVSLLLLVLLPYKYGGLWISILFIVLEYFRWLMLFFRLDWVCFCSLVFCLVPSCIALQPEILWVATSFGNFLRHFPIYAVLPFSALIRRFWHCVYPFRHRRRIFLTKTFSKTSKPILKGMKYIKVSLDVTCYYYSCFLKMAVAISLVLVLVLENFN